MTDRAALLLAVCQEPAEDTPRLVYADCLDDEGEHERAEFIRVQVALANAPTTCDRTFCDGQLVVCEECREWKRLRKRASALEAAIREEWLRQSRGWPMIIAYDSAVFRRGFVDEIEVDHEAWTPEFAAAICRQTPLSRVRLRGMEPVQSGGTGVLDGNPSWDWYRYSGIGVSLINLMADLYPGSPRDVRDWLEFPTEAAAHDALAHTAAEWGRRLAFGTARAMA